MHASRYGAYYSLPMKRAKLLFTCGVYKTGGAYFIAMEHCSKFIQCLILSFCGWVYGK